MHPRERLIRLRAEVGALHAADAAGPAPTTTEHWLTGRRRVRDAVLADDPEQLLSWPVVVDTMLVAGDRHHPYLPHELAVLQADPQWAQVWEPACAEDGVGEPPPMPGLPGSSGNRVHHAYQFRLLQEATGLAVRELGQVIEFGAGYGAMAAVAHKLGFSGSYTVFDLPEWSALQRWYLDAVGLPDVRVTSAEDELAATVAAAGPDTLLTAMWSLSETPLALRDRVLPGGEQCGGYLFGYQPRFEGIDNLAWFAAFRAARPDVDWSGGDPEPGSGNRYLVGRRRA